MNKDKKNNSRSLIYPIILAILVGTSKEFQMVDLLYSPELFYDEICSYNGKMTINSTNNEYKCICGKDFASVNKDKYINNILVQCDYFKKRQFIAVFLSIFIPFGFDYFYLGYYLIFSFVFLLCFSSLIGNCYRFTASSHKNYFKNKINLLFALLGVFAVGFWIINVICMSLGIIKDVNGVEMFPDLYLLVNIKSDY